MTRQSAESRLAGLRRRLTLSFALVSLVGIAGLAAATTVIDSRLRTDRFDAELQGRAFRAAALVFLDGDTGRWDATGIAGDVVAETSDGIIVVDGASRLELFATASLEDSEAIVTAALSDDAEDGTLGTVTINGSPIPAAAAPYFGPTQDDSDDSDDSDNADDVVVGAVVVAATQGSEPDRRQLLAFVWGAAAALTAASAALAWLTASRIVRPMGEQLDREEAFLATAAHELRTPLGRFQAVTESALLTSRDLPTGSARDGVVTDLRRLLQLTIETTSSVEDLLLLGRIEAGQLANRREEVRLDVLVAGFESTVPELAVDTDAAVTVIGDPILIHHAVSNLLINAKQHGRRAGEWLLIEATVNVSGHDALLVIADNGQGLGDESETIFLRHQTTGAIGGLGLWIVRTIVEQHGGTVSGRNRPEGGAVFEIRWPLA